MSDSINATFSRGFNQNSNSWQIKLEGNAKMTQTEWEAFMLDLNAFLDAKYPKLKLVDKP